MSVALLWGHEGVVDSPVLWVVIDFSSTILLLMLELIHDLRKQLNSGRWNTIESMEGITQ